MTETHVKELVPLNREHYSYLTKYKHNDTKATGDSNVKIDFVKSTNTTPTTDSSQYAVQLTGLENSVTLFKEVILRQLQSVITSIFIFGVRSGLNSDDVKVVVKDIARCNSCVAQIEIPVDHVDWRVPDGAQRLSETGDDPFVTVVFNELQKQKVDVIVNTLHRNLTLGVGAISSALLKSCGDEVQEELREKYPGGIENGGLAVSGSGRMRTCQQIYHGALPALKGLESLPVETCYQNMIRLVYSCLQEASASGHVTIALPALGTGALAYPAEDVAYLMFKSVRLFLTQCPFTSIEKIFFVLYPAAPLELKQIFLAYCASQTVETTVVNALRFEDALGPDMKSPEVLFRVGDTLVKVLNADLTEACHKSCPQLVLWNEADVKGSQMNRESPYSGYSYNLSDLPTTQTAVEKDSRSSRPVIHSYIQGGSEKDLRTAVKMGLKRGKSENYLTLVLSLVSGDRLSNDVVSTTVSLLQGVKDSKPSVCVLAVFIPDRTLFSGFVTAARGSGYTSLNPPEAHVQSLADKTWDDFSQDRIQGALRMIETGNTAILTVTSDSEQTNREVARKIQENIRAGVSGRSVFSGSNTYSLSGNVSGRSTESRRSSESSSSDTESWWGSLRRRGTLTLRDIRRAFKLE